MSLPYWLNPDNENDDFDYEDEHVELESDKDEYDDEDEDEDEVSPAAKPTKTAAKHDAGSAGTRDAAGSDQKESGMDGRASGSDTTDVTPEDVGSGDHSKNPHNRKKGRT